MELLIPDSYVANIPERMRLYRELNLIADSNDLEKFQQKLEDRFGTAPDQVKELLNVVRIRMIAKNLGFEKIILKNKLFIGIFISNQLSPFYRSATFMRIISSIQKNPSKFKLKEQREKLSLLAENVKTTSEAIELLKSLDVAENSGGSQSVIT